MGRMILHLAARYENMNAVEYLTRQKRAAIPINARDNLGKIPLDYVRALMLYYGAFAVTNIPRRSGYQVIRVGGKVENRSTHIISGARVEQQTRF